MDADSRWKIFRLFLSDIRVCYRADVDFVQELEESDDEY